MKSNSQLSNNSIISNLAEYIDDSIARKSYPQLRAFCIDNNILYDDLMKMNRELKANDDYTLERLIRRLEDFQIVMLELGALTGTLKGTAVIERLNNALMERENEKDENYMGVPNKYIAENFPNLLNLD